jgi:disulfide bond formation protein DsbB
MIVGAYSSTQVDVTKAFSVLGIAGQAIVAVLALASVLALLGARGPLDSVRRALWGYELWAGFVVAAVATGGSLFYSEVMGFVPCELCWYQRICMYPLSIPCSWRRGSERRALPATSCCSRSSGQGYRSTTC